MDMGWWGAPAPYHEHSRLPAHFPAAPGDSKHGAKQGESYKYSFSTSSFPLGGTDLPCCSGVHTKTELQKEQGVEISLFWGAKLMKNQSGLKNPLTAIMH